MRMTERIFDDIPNLRRWNDFFVKTLEEDSIVRVKCNDLAWIEVEDSVTTFHFMSGGTLPVGIDINTLSSKLPQDVFARINRTEVVNIHLVNKIIGNTLTIENHTFVVDEAHRECVFPCFNALI